MQPSSLMWYFWRVFCFVDRAFMYNLVNKTNLVHRFILSTFINLHTFRATMCPSSGDTSVFLRHCTCYSVWMTVWYAGCTLHTRQSSTQNNKYKVSQKHSCFSWWWAHSRPKHVEVDKYTKNKSVHQVVLFTRVLMCFPRCVCSLSNALIQCIIMFFILCV